MWIIVRGVNAVVFENREQAIEEAKRRLPRECVDTLLVAEVSDRVVLTRILEVIPEDSPSHA
jgi:hypothetical protein